MAHLADLRLTWKIVGWGCPDCNHQEPEGDDPWSTREFGSWPTCLEREPISLNVPMLEEISWADLSSETSYWYCPSTTVATRVASLNTELSHSLRMLLPLASAPCFCTLQPAHAPCSYTPLPVPSRSCHTFYDTSPSVLTSAHHRHTNPAAFNSEPKSRPKDAEKQALACTAREKIETDWISQYL